MAETTTFRYEPTPLHPGDHVVEYLEENGWTQRDLSRRTDLTPKTISEICNGKAPISPATALALENVLGRPAHFWLNLQSQYDEAVARAALKPKMEHWSEWADRFPVDKVIQLQRWADRFPIKEMRKYRWIDSTDAARPAAEVLLKFFGVASPESWESVFTASNVVYRQTRKNQISTESISAWIRATEIAASELETATFNEGRLRAILPELRAQTREAAESFIPATEKILARAGVAVVWVPELTKTGISGCARWLTDDKALIALTLRYKSDDQLWFTFFHEIGHLLLHRKKNGFILDNPDNDLDDRVVDPQMRRFEDEANLFSADTLIPSEQLQGFINQNDFRTAAIHEFADRINVGPGIVVGRLQRDRVLNYHQGNTLKRKFHWHFASET